MLNKKALCLVVLLILFDLLVSAAASEALSHFMCMLKQAHKIQKHIVVVVVFDGLFLQNQLALAVEGVHHSSIIKLPDDDLATVFGHLNDLVEGFINLALLALGACHSCLVGLFS